MDLILKTPRTTPGLMLESDKSGLVFRKELIYANAPGEKFVKRTETHNQEFTVDANRIKHWEETGNRMIENGLKVPVPLKHTDDPEKNRGEVIAFESGINEDGREALFGVIKFRDLEAAKLAASTDVSIFVPDKPVIDGLGNEYHSPIRHVCCTDYPVIPKLGKFEAIALSLELSTPVKFISKLGRYALNQAKAHPVGAAASAVGTAGWLHRHLKSTSYEGVKKTDSTLSKVGKVAAGAAVGAAGLYFVKHGAEGLIKTGARLASGINNIHRAKSVASASRYGKSFGVKHIGAAALGAGVGVKSTFVGYHSLKQGSEIVNGEKHKATALSNELILDRHSLKAPGGSQFISKRAAAALKGAETKRLKAVKITREAAMKSPHFSAPTKYAAAAAGIIAAAALAHHLFGKKKSTELSLSSHEDRGSLIGPIIGHRRANKIDHAVMSAIAAGASLASAAAVPVAVASSIAGGVGHHLNRQMAKKSGIHLKNHLGRFAGAKAVGIPLGGALVSGYIAHRMLKGAKYHYKKAFTKDDVAASLELENSDGYARSEKGRFATNPHSKRQRMLQRRAMRAKSNASASVSSNTYNGSHHSNKAPTYRGAIANAKNRIHDFYHADEHELNSGSNLLHAVKHASVGALHAGVAGLAAYSAYKAGHKIARGNWKSGLAHLAATSGASAAASMGAFDHFDAAVKHAKAIISRRSK